MISPDVLDIIARRSTRKQLGNLMLVMPASHVTVILPYYRRAEAAMCIFKFLVEHSPKHLNTLCVNEVCLSMGLVNPMNPINQWKAMCRIDKIPFSIILSYILIEDMEQHGITRSFTILRNSPYDIIKHKHNVNRIYFNSSEEMPPITYVCEYGRPIGMFMLRQVYISDLLNDASQKIKNQFLYMPQYWYQVIRELEDDYPDAPTCELSNMMYETYLVNDQLMIS
jgi:hypothetical protein